MGILKWFPNTIAADMARLQLLSHGIDAVVPAEPLENTLWLDFHTGGARLMVQDEDANSAAAILRALEADDSEGFKEPK